jgi:CheY-like chemotaxis protein
LPFRIIVEHQDVGDVTNFLDRLERMRPDVVLIDISNWKEPLEGWSSIRSATGDPMIIALNTSADPDPILAALRAGINEYLVSAASRPAQEGARKALRRTQPAARVGRQEGGKGFAFFSAKGGCGASTLVCHVAAELGRQNQKVLPDGPRHGLRHGRVHHQDQVGLFHPGRRQQSAPAGHSLLEGADLEWHSGRGDHGVAAGAGFQDSSPPATRSATFWPSRVPNYDWTLVDLGRSLSRIAPWRRWKRSTKPAW